MKQTAFFLMISFVVSGLLAAGTGPVFDETFIDATMRIDYLHIGDAVEEIITLDRIYRQGTWAGSLTNLIDPFNNGRHYIKVYDAKSKNLIYSRGFDSYFGEYQTTGKAANGIKRSYHETALIPYPKKPILFTIEARDKKSKTLYPVLEQEIDPDSYFINRDALDSDVSIFKLHVSGDPHVKVDVAIVAEGYTVEEREKLVKDFSRISKTFFAIEPYISLKDRFNLWGVFKPSQESGCDEPSHGSYRNTAVGATFDSLGSERYLLTEDNLALHDIAAHVPYDFLYILVNTDRYGGGGIYNFFCTVTSDNQWTSYVLLHEFGHHFAGLADEYYSSSTAYDEFYAKGVEPVEPNITALLDKDQLKWSDLVTPGIEIPTPWEKKEFDTMNNKYQKIRQEINEKLAKLKRESAPEDEILRMKKRSEELSRKHAKKVDAYLEASAFAGKVGVFEGAGYTSEGLYRSELDCLMFTKGAKPFCAACEAAVRRVISYYSE